MLMRIGSQIKLFFIVFFMFLFFTLKPFFISHDRIRNPNQHLLTNYHNMIKYKQKFTLLPAL